MTEVRCPKCNSLADLVTGDVVYPKSKELVSKWFYYCDNEHSPMWVGCIGNTKTPMGTLADEFTRYWRQRAHIAFDIIWKTNKLTRTGAYSKLAKELSLETKFCHIGMFDAKQCKRVVEIAQKWINDCNKNTVK